MYENILASNTCRTPKQNINMEVKVRKVKVNLPSAFSNDEGQVILDIDTLLKGLFTLICVPFLTVPSSHFFTTSLRRFLFKKTLAHFFHKYKQGSVSEQNFVKHTKCSRSNTCLLWIELGTTSATTHCNTGEVTAHTYRVKSILYRNN